MKRRHFCVLTLALLLASLLFAYPAHARNLEVTVANKTDAPVWLAFARVSAGGENDADFARGWWKVEPGQTKRLSVMEYSPVYGYFYFAFSPTKKRFWHGRNMAGGTEFWVNKSKHFKSFPGKPLPGGVRYYFRPLKENMGKAKLSLTTR